MRYCFSAYFFKPLLDYLQNKAYFQFPCCLSTPHKRPCFQLLCIFSRLHSSSHTYSCANWQTFGKVGMSSPNDTRNIVRFVICRSVYCKQYVTNLSFKRRFSKNWRFAKKTMQINIVALFFGWWQNVLCKEEQMKMTCAIFLRVSASEFASQIERCSFFKSDTSAVNQVF